MRKPLILFTILLSLTMCHRKSESTSAKSTETIAPAAPQPAQNDSDVMTQTVNVEDGRSEAEGGALTETTTAKATTTAKPAPPPPTRTTT